MSVYYQKKETLTMPIINLTNKVIRVRYKENKPITANF